MTRLTRFCFAVLVGMVLFAPSLAHAGWHTKEIKWRISNVGGNNGTSIFIRDTTYTLLGVDQGGVADTSADFSLDDADPIPRSVAAPPGLTGNFSAGGTTGWAGAPNDTMTIGYLILTADSLAAPAATITSMTCLIDGRVGPYGTTVTRARGWVKADSALVSGAAGGTLILGNESIAVPIRSITPYGNVWRWPWLRARITASTGFLSSCRVFLRYWSNDSSNPHQP